MDEVRQLGRARDPRNPRRLRRGLGECRKTQKGDNPEESS
jgi:hypothetical protein